MTPQPSILNHGIRQHNCLLNPPTVAGCLLYGGCPLRLVKTPPPRTIEAIDAELRALGATLADQLANGNRIDELLEERQELVRGDGQHN